MGLKLHMALQGLLVVAQPMADPLIAALGIAPDWARVIHTGLGACNALLAWIAHHHNTDGTPQQVAGPGA